MSMTLNEYQKLVHDTAIYPGCDGPRGAGLSYVALGLNGEAGEIADHAKKILRDDNGLITVERGALMMLEGGDALWYNAELATQLGTTLEAMAQANIRKLAMRKFSGTLRGSGDKR